jgi:hypothetical protein
MIGIDPLDLGFTEFESIFGENAGAIGCIRVALAPLLSSSTSPLFPKGAS